MFEVTEGVSACIAVAKEEGLGEPELVDGYPVWNDVHVANAGKYALPGTWQIIVIGGPSPPNVAFPANDELLKQMLAEGFEQSPEDDTA